MRVTELQTATFDELCGTSRGFGELAPRARA